MLKAMLKAGHGTALLQSKPSRARSLVGGQPKIQKSSGKSIALWKNTCLAYMKAWVMIPNTTYAKILCYSIDITFSK